MSQAFSFYITLLCFRAGISNMALLLIQKASNSTQMKVSFLAIFWNFSLLESGPFNIRGEMSSSLSFSFENTHVLK